ncbi:hypothetical protein VIGAN_01412000 [Vigna angularis var. angularis]|uniref:Uncharacterized protein n=1 Tax=Vigna angularis var. angularis TaxID=157739 RepID=A0A0S3R6N7_PHAAN|nr:hypothetical protein VIGAN_01412000 [Vigna angularis var. angularis]
MSNERPGDHQAPWNSRAQYQKRMKNGVSGKSGNLLRFCRILQNARSFQMARLISGRPNSVSVRP